MEESHDDDVTLVRRQSLQCTADSRCRRQSVVEPRVWCRRLFSERIRSPAPAANFINESSIGDNAQPRQCEALIAALLRFCCVDEYVLGKLLSIECASGSANEVAKDRVAEIGIGCLEIERPLRRRLRRHSHYEAADVRPSARRRRPVGQPKH